MWCRSYNDWGKVIGIPLAVAALILSSIQLIYAILSLLSAFVVDGTSSAAKTITCVVAALHGMFAVLVMISVLCRWIRGMRLANAMIKFFIISWIVYCLSIIVYRFIDLSKGTDYPRESWAALIILSVVTILAFIFCTAILSIFKSLTMILESGGSGFEGLNYKQVKTGSRAVSALESEGTISVVSGV